MFAGACAKTKMLACVPTSAGRGWISALAVTAVVVIDPVTVMGNRGDAAATFAVNVPCSARGVPSW